MIAYSSAQASALAIAVVLFIACLVGAMRHDRTDLNTRLHDGARIGDQPEGGDQ